MSHKTVSNILLKSFIAVALAGWTSSVVTAQISGTDGYLTANAVAQNYFQRRLLEFVAPTYQQPLLSSSLVEGLSRPGPNATPGQKLAAEKIAFAGASAAQVEMQTRILELSLRQQMMQRNGMAVSGSIQTLKAGGLSAKSLALQAKVQVLEDQLAVERAKYRYQGESRKERLAYRLETIKARPNTGLNARSGHMINVILESIRPTILKYGYGLGANSSYRDEIKALTLDPEDIAKIQLQLEVEGPPVIFTADKGSIQLGQLPFAMNHAELTPLVKDIESKIEAISKLTQGPEFYQKTLELSAAIENLEVASERVLGTARESAQRGSNDYRLWRLAKDYRTRMRGIVNRLELEGSPAFLKSSAKKFDTTVNGNDVLAFVRFIAENNCKIAPAAEGDEATYVRFLSLVTQLEAILDN